MKEMVEKELFDKNGIVMELFREEYVRNVWSFTLTGQDEGIPEDGLFPQYMALIYIQPVV